MEATRESDWIDIGRAAEMALAGIERRARMRNWIVFAEQAIELSISLGEQNGLAHAALACSEARMARPMVVMTAGTTEFPMARLRSSPKGTP
jgi:hypothetical protein